MTDVLFVAAAEGSGDALVAELVPVLRARREVELVGVAGPRMRAAGVRALMNAEDLGGFGFVEVVHQIPRALRALRALERAASETGAQVALTVDAPSLWLPLGRRLRRRGLSVVHWVAPQVWAWRPGRVREVGRSVDAVLCLFPFEPPLFSGHCRAVFVGHPAAAVRPRPVRVDGGPRIALCPGSRPGEIRRLWPVFREVARCIRVREPEAAFVVPVAPTVGRAGLGGLDVTYVDGIAEVGGVDAALVASGTATLELAALDVPMVVAYQVHPVSAFLARRLVTVPDVALPNVLAGERLVPEHLQELDPEAIAADVLRWVGRRGQVPRALLEGLGGEGAIARVADEVAGWLAAAVTRPAGPRRW